MKQKADAGVAYRTPMRANAWGRRQQTGARSANTCSAACSTPCHKIAIVLANDTLGTCSSHTARNSVQLLRRRDPAAKLAPSKEGQNRRLTTPIYTMDTQEGGLQLDRYSTAGGLQNAPHKECAHSSGLEDSKGETDRAGAQTLQT